MDFFGELEKLRSRVPHPCILSVNSENCGYCPYHANGKNCYLIVGHNKSEDCLYGVWVGYSRDCVDNSFLDNSELCYECVDCRDCYDCDFSQECSSCCDCEWCHECKGCSNCFGCVNLRNKSYCIFNVQYSKEQYREKVARLKKMCNAAGQPDEFVRLKKESPRQALQGFNNENVFGEHIYNSRNALYCFDVRNQEDTAYIYNSPNLKNAMDCCYNAQGSELNYMVHSGVTLYNSNFCNVCWYCQNLEYCEFVFNSHDCFGCVSRNHAQYEILNEKCDKNDYFKRVAEIKAILKKEGSYGRWWWPSPYPQLMPSPSYTY